MEQITLELTGTAPLLMHRPITVDVLNPLTQEIKALTGKRKKTLDDIKIIQRLEWQAGLYHDEVIGPYLPGVNIETCLRDAGKLSKQGAAVTRGVVCGVANVPVEYDGPRTIQEMWDANMKDYRRVGNQQNSVMRCRPQFPRWTLSVPLYVEESVIDVQDVQAIAVKAGLMIGLGDYRPRFGRFSVA